MKVTSNTNGNVLNLIQQQVHAILHTVLSLHIISFSQTSYCKDGQQPRI